MKKFLILIFLIHSVLLLLGGACAAEIAIIVNKENNETGLSLRELKKIFRQEKQYWDNRKIYIILQESGTAGKAIALMKIYGMSEGELKKLWLAKMYRGEIEEYPKVLASDEAVKRFVSMSSSAIGFIKAESVDDTVNVLKVEGKLPQDDGYLLSDR